MHDVVVGVALLFFVTAMVTLFHRLHLQRRVGRLTAGIGCRALTLRNGTRNCGNVLSGFLPTVQKVSLVLRVSYLLRLFITDSQKMNRAGRPKNLLHTHRRCGFVAGANSGGGR